MSSIQERFYRVIYQIPYGKVATYGQVAELAGAGRAARHVGATLKGLPAKSKLPWHRVINSGGRISLPGNRGKTQQHKLEAEGVVFINNKISLAVYRWQP